MGSVIWNCSHFANDRFAQGLSCIAYLCDAVVQVSNEGCNQVKA